MFRSGNVEKRKRVEFNGSDPVGGGEMVVQTHPEEMKLLFWIFWPVHMENDVQFTNHSFMSEPVQNPPTQLYLYLYTIISYSARARLGRFPCVKPLCTHRSPLLLPMIIVTHILMIQPPRMWDYALASSNSWWLCALVSSILIRFSSSFFLWLSPDKNQQNHTRSSLIRLEFFPHFILIVLLTKVV